MDRFLSSEFLDGQNERTNANRESFCKSFCPHRKKHKCLLHKCRIKNANCDPVAEYMKQKGRQ